MSRTLLLGRAGAGKTHCVVAAVRAHLDAHDAAGRFARFQVVVPTYSQAEHLKRRLLRRSDGLEALLDRGIGTFEQLAERETGVRLHALAPATVRDALVLAALEDDDFPDFRPVRRFPGFRRAVLRFVKEIKASEPEPGVDAVASAAERLTVGASALAGVASRKLEGMARALAGYQRRLEAAGLVDHEDLLRLLLARLREMPTPPPEDRLRLFAVDGFTDLTQVQERVVQLLAAQSERSLVTLLGDPAGDRDGPFAASAGLLGRLVSASGFAISGLTETPRLSGDLLRVEQRASGVIVPPAAPDGSVRLLAGADPADEADRAARTCLRWISEGVPRQEILVVVRRLDGETGERVLDALRRHDVAFRRSSGAALTSVPAASSALRALRLLAGAAAPGELLDAVRAGDARGVPDREAAILFAAARPVGARSAADLLRLASEHDLGGVMAWLAALDGWRLEPRSAAPADVARALLEGLPRLLRWSYEGAVATADEARAAEDAAALRKVRDLMAEVVRALGAAARAEVTPLDLLALLEATVADARCPLRDQRVDVVNVVDAEEARQWEASAVVVCGLRMGEFPAGAREDLFVADRDRSRVEKDCGVRLPARLDEALRRERLLFYSAVTRARSWLVLTAPVADDGGDPVLPSPFLESLREIFPEDDRGLEGAGRTPGDVRPERGEAFGVADVERSVLAALGERHRPGGEAEVRAHAGIAVLRRLDEPERDALLRAAQSRVRAGEPVTLQAGGAAAAAMARPRPRSASSLGSFRQCAYRHFAEKGLGLREPEPSPEDGLSPLVAGDIAHRALEAIFGAGALTNAAGSGDVVTAVFDRIWSDRTVHLVDGITLAAHRAALLHAIQTLVLGQASKPLAAGFAPAAAEWRFGFDEGDEVVVAPGAGDVRIRGIVDRIDEAAARTGHDGGARTPALVVDYKWSDFGRFSGLDRRIEAGDDLQLPLYALAVSRARGRDVVAAGYLTLRDGRMRWVRLAADAPKGGSSDVDWTADAAERLAAVESMVVELDAGIRAGRVDVAPRDPDKCGYCAYGDLCRVDERAP